MLRIEEVANIGVVIIAALGSVGIMAQADVPGWLSKAAEVGIMASLVVYFVWQSYQREARMAARMNSLEDFQRTDLSEMIARHHEIIAKVCEHLDSERK